MPTLIHVIAFAYPPSVRRDHGSEIAEAIQLRWRDAPAMAQRLRVVLDLVKDVFSSWTKTTRRSAVKSTSSERPGRSWPSDVRDAYRFYRHAPMFTLGAVATLALGIGASTAIVSLADATLLRPLPIPEPSRVMQATFSWSYPDFRDFVNDQRAFSVVAGWTNNIFGVERAGGTVQVSGAGVTGDYFTLAGQSPVVGRLLTREDDRLGAPAVAVLSERLWHREFAEDRGIIGATLVVNRRPVTVVGVAPGRFRGFSLQATLELFVPLAALPDLSTGFLSQPGVLTNRGRVWINQAGRLNDGVSQAQADLDVRNVYRRLHPSTGAKTAEPDWLTPLLGQAVGAASAADLRQFILTLIAATVVTLLLTCATVANLLLVRGERRTHELAVRGALGAGRMRLVRQRLIEGAGIGVLGGVASVGVAAATLGVLGRFSLPGQILIRDLAVTVNWPLLAASIGIGLMTALVFGAAPAWQAARLDTMQTLKRGVRATSRLGLRSWLVGIQVALCVLLLGGGLAFGRAMQFALGIDLGFNVTNTTITGINASLARYPVERVRAFQQQSLEALRAQPHVRAAGWAAIRPMKGMMQLSPVIDGYQPAKEEEIKLQANIVSDGYLEAMGIPVLEGRTLSTRDDVSSPRVVAISAAAARKYWPGRSALGGRISMEDAGARDPKWMTVVAVVGDIHRTLGASETPLLYVPIGQSPNALEFGYQYLIVRGNDEAADTARDVRATLLRIDPNMPIVGSVPMTDHVGDLLMAHRLGLTLFLLFAGLSLLLTTLGLYAVVATAVSVRTREIGIRVALGAEAATVMRLILRQGALPVCLGLAAGLVAFGLSATMIQQFMFSLPATNAAVLFALAVTIGIVAAVAIALPARRALRVSPTVALRAE